MFYNCGNLESIIIPDGVKEIGSSAFWGCRGLTSITFKGTKEGWSLMHKGEGWNYEVPAKEVHCSDGDVDL